MRIVVPTLAASALVAGMLVTAPAAPAQEPAAPAARPTAKIPTSVGYGGAVSTVDPEASAEMVARIDQAHEDGDTLGGVVEVVVHGLPPGLGSYVHWDRRLDSRLAGALMGIQAIKGVEVGDGFELAATPGSEAHDEHHRADGRQGGTAGTYDGSDHGQAARFLWLRLQGA